MLLASTSRPGSTCGMSADSCRHLTSQHVGHVSHPQISPYWGLRVSVVTGWGMGSGCLRTHPGEAGRMVGGWSTCELSLQAPGACCIISLDLTYETNSKITIVKNFKTVTEEH